MEPTTIALRDLSPNLHRTLAERAMRNHRSPNGEILATLQASLDFAVDVEMLLAKADLVEKLSFRTTPIDTPDIWIAALRC